MKKEWEKPELIVRDVNADTEDLVGPGTDIAIMDSSRIGIEA